MVKSRSVTRNAENARGLGRDEIVVKAVGSLVLLVYGLSLIPPKRENTCSADSLFPTIYL